MKISELKTIAKENDYELKGEKEIEQIILERKVTFDGFISNVIRISLIKKNLIFIKSKYCDDKDFNMIKAAVEFAETAIEAREEEKKFYLRHRWIFDKDFYIYLQKASYDDKKMSFGVINFSGNDGLKFTLKEIEEIKEKYNTDLKDFEIIEVEE